MPNKLRLRNRDEIADILVSQLSREDMVQEVYNNIFDFINNIGDEELEETYEDQPELLYEPTLSQQLDEIFNKLSENLKNLSSNTAWELDFSNTAWWGDMYDFHEGMKYQLDQIRKQEK